MENYPTNKGGFTVLAAEAGSIADRTSDGFKNAGAKSLILTVVLANKVGTVTFTPVVQMKLPNGTWVTIWTAAAALSTAGTYVYELNRDTHASASGITESKVVALPHDWRVFLDYTGAGAGNSFDTTVYGELVV